MIEYFDSAPDVIALRITGKLSRDEIMGTTERIERAFAGNEKTHVFIEIEDYCGFEWSAVGEHLPHAWNLLRQREKFGRVAVVSDHAWIRWVTRIESALIPGLSYETYKADERGQALAWVEGRSPYPHGQALTMIETTNPDVFAFELDGRIGAEEMHALVARINALMDGRPGPVRLLGRFKDFRMPAPSAVDGDYLSMKLKALHRVERYAVVGGPSWLASWISVMSPLFRAEVRHFSADGEVEAWDWVGAAPAGAHSRAA